MTTIDLDRAPARRALARTLPDVFDATVETHLDVGATLGPTAVVLPQEALAKALGDTRRLAGPRDGLDGAWRASPLPMPDGFCGWVCWR
ncbi:hypothetical protein DVA67_027845 [Solirubrobacter sp. CPCC 204708]|uniref:Uncharacterized protein n=1 Tax=Solirubrobacter deserti TaxID=2282478 RepID=A0ABT4RJH7_9ACTN|nr:hypothetical protein [Solirubrobacter deserti]MBE2319809.1 hypothetical protein [Solirubrobacter deserti]MDA0138709.1 hypothetical protein [Solirubrobacter deserti]